MRNLVVLLISILVLTGCSAAGLKQAEEKTRLAGMASPLGAVIHLPLWVASTVANVGSGSAGETETMVEKRRQDWRPGLPGDISREAYEALSDEEYEALMKQAVD